MDDSGPGTPSFKYRLKKSICCCFRQQGSAADSSTAISRSYHSVPTTSTPRVQRNSSQWINSCSNEFPEFKDRCRNLINRIGNNHNHRRRRSHSMDLRYDPLSYALNFEEIEDLDTQADEYLPLRNFTARLPQSPLGIAMPMSAPAAEKNLTFSPVRPVTEFSRRTTSDGVIGMKVEISREITAFS